MKKSYTELMEQIQALQREAEKARHAEVQSVIKRIKEAIVAYGLTAQDLGFAPPAPAAAGGRRRSARPPKYRDQAGNVWSGRGPRPRWLKEALRQGARLEQFSASAAD